jgi:hypothetical protein
MGIVRKPKDFYFGAILLVIALGLFYVSLGYPFGTARQMGAGYFPVVLSAILAILSLILIGRSFFGPYEPVEGIVLRPLVLILGGSLLFGLLIRPAGLVIAIVAMIFVGALASPESRLLSTIVLALALALGSVLAFVYGLGQPIPILGYWFR